MTSSATTLRYDDWIDRYHPKVNPHEDHGFDGTLFETYKPDINTVHAQIGTGRVWTLLDDGQTLISGFQLVNRLGYFITEVPCFEEVEVRIDY